MSVQHFDEIAAAYDTSLPAHVVEHYLDRRTAFLTGLVPTGAVLDVGCGTGLLAQRLSARGYQVVGVDPSEGMLEVMRARNPEVQTVRASGDALPFSSARFDLVVTVATLHHIAAPDRVRGTLAEMVRVCRAGGRIVVWDHNPRNPYWPRLMSRVPQDTGEERLIGESEIASGLTGGGARVLSVAHLGLVPDFTPPWALRSAAALERAFESIPYLRRMAAHNVVVAQPCGPTLGDAQTAGQRGTN
jgi:SAM-dependent methyltransferase